jgi:hypothetical protein
LFLPTVVVYEVYKKMLREATHEQAERFLSTAFGFQEREIVLDVFGDNGREDELDYELTDG